MYPHPPSWLGSTPPLDLVAGPAPFYVSGEDHFQLLSFCTTAGVTLALCGRFLTNEGRIVPFLFDGHPASAVGATVTTKHPLGEGWVLNLSVFASAGTPTGTTCPVVVRVARGLSGATQTLGVIAQGFITATQEVTFPLTLASAGSSSAATSIIRSVTGTNPAAGSEVTETVPASKVWRLNSIRIPFTTNATVANRTVSLTIDDGTNLLFGTVPGLTQPASVTDNYHFAEGRYENTGTTAFLVAGLPVNLRLGAGFRIRTSTTNLQAGDDFAAPQMLVEEWSA